MPMAPGGSTSPPEAKGHDTVLLVLLTEPVRIWKLPDIEWVYITIGVVLDSTSDCRVRPRFGRWN
jgi:hypothetical protein